MSSLVADYRLERAAQDNRFDNRPGAGSVDHSCTDSEEYKAYFGLGEWAGSGVEERVTYKSFLRSRGRESAAERLAARAWVALPASEWVDTDAAVRLPGKALQRLAAAGDAVAADEIDRRRVRRVARRQLAVAV